MSEMGRGSERTLWEEIDRLDAPNSVAGRTVPWLGGTVTWNGTQSDSLFGSLAPRLSPPNRAPCPPPRTSPVRAIRLLRRGSQPLTYSSLFRHQVRVPRLRLLPPRGPWRGLEPAEIATLEWVHWFNHRHILEPIGNRPPAEAEAAYYRQREHTTLAA